MQPIAVGLITLLSAAVAASRASLIVETRSHAAGEITPATSVGQETTRIQWSKLIEVRQLSAAWHAIQD